MFSESRLISYSITGPRYDPEKLAKSALQGKKPKTSELLRAIIDPTSAKVRAKYGLNTKKGAEIFNKEKAEMAGKEMAYSTESVIKSLYYGVKHFGLGATKMVYNTVTDPFKISYDTIGNIGYKTMDNLVGGSKYLAMNAIKTSVNVGTGLLAMAGAPFRIAGDMLRVIPRPFLILADEAAQAAGWPSRIANKFRLRIHKTLMDKAKKKEEKASKKAEAFYKKYKFTPSDRVLESMEETRNKYKAFDSKFGKETLLDHPK